MILNAQICYFSTEVVIRLLIMLNLLPPTHVLAGSANGIIANLVFFAIKKIGDNNKVKNSNDAIHKYKSCTHLHCIYRHQLHLAHWSEEMKSRIPYFHGSFRNYQTFSLTSFSHCRFLHRY